VIPHQQAATLRSSTKQGFGVPRRVLFGGDTIRSTVPPSLSWTTSQLYSSFRNQEDKDDVSINQFTSTSTTSKNTDDIRNKQEYQERIEEIQRQRFDRAANKTSTPQELVRLGIACCFALLILVVALKNVMPE
jgi:hypothetical protein